MDFLKGQSKDCCCQIECWGEIKAEPQTVARSKTMTAISVLSK